MYVFIFGNYVENLASAGIPGIFHLTHQHKIYVRTHRAWEG